VQLAEEGGYARKRPVGPIKNPPPLQEADVAGEAVEDTVSTPTTYQKDDFFDTLSSDLSGLNIQERPLRIPFSEQRKVGRFAPPPPTLPYRCRRWGQQRPACFSRSFCLPLANNYLRRGSFAWKMWKIPLSRAEGKLQDILGRGGGDICRFNPGGFGH